MPSGTGLMDDHPDWATEATDSLDHSQPIQAAPEATRPENRRTPRNRVLRRAQLIASGTVLDCLVLEVSATGIRLRFGTPLPIPEQATLRLVQDGTSHTVKRRWARGVEAGFELDGSGSVADQDRRTRAQAARQALRAVAPTEAIQILQASWFFGDEEVRRMAEALEAAHARLDAALQPHAKAGLAAAEDEPG